MESDVCAQSVCLLGKCFKRGCSMECLNNFWENFSRNHFQNHLINAELKFKLSHQVAEPVHAKLLGNGPHGAKHENMFPNVVVHCPSQPCCSKRSVLLPSPLARSSTRARARMHAGHTRTRPVQPSDARRSLSRSGRRCSPLTAESGH